MSSYVGGHKRIDNVELVTAGANFAAKTLVDADGGVTTAAAATFGVCKTDTPSGQDAEVITSGIVAVIAGGSVTAGAIVEAVDIGGGVTGNISGTATSITATGVEDQTSTNVRIGRAITGGSSGDTVLIEIGGIQY